MLHLTNLDLNFGNLFIVLLFPLFLLLLAFLNVLKSQPKLKLPPGPVGLPLFGYLPFLGKEPFKTLDKLSKVYGNVFSLYLGRTYVVILGDYTAVKDAFSKSTTIDRPAHLFDFLPGGVGFSSVNGQEWAEQRRYTVRTMTNLGLGKGPWEYIITEEVEEFVKIVREYNGQPINICKLLIASVSNNVASLVLGKRLPSDDPKRDVLDSSIDAVSQFFSQSGIRNYFPQLCNLFVKLGIGGFDKWHAKMINFNEYIMSEVREREIQGRHDSNNFIDNYVEEMKARRERNEETTFNETNLCGNVKALLVGASDTTRTSLNWLLIAVALHQELQKKIQQELDNVLGPGKMASWDDRLKVPYTYAVIMEGQRWKTVAPLNTSRIAQEDIKICDFDVPKGSTIIANNWGLHNDIKYWKDPEEFRPERFLKDDGSVNLKPESYVPFSYGKRNCPGETVAMMEILLYFTALLSNFNVVTGEPGGKPILDATLGLTYQAVQQTMCFVPRSCISKTKDEITQKASSKTSS